MDEAMDTSSDVLETLDPQSRNESELQLNTSMETSPILSRHIVRNISRTPRNLVSSSGWINTVNIRQQSPTTSSEVTVTPAASSHQELNEPTVPTQGGNDIVVVNPPPIEDTDLIMIHRPVPSNIIPDVDSGDNVSTDTSNSVDGLPDDNMEGRTETLIEEAPPVEALPSENESVPLMEEDQPRDIGGDMSLVHEEVQTNPLPVTAGPAPSPAPDVENLPLAQRIRSPDVGSPSESPPLKKVKVQPEVTKTEDSYEEEEGKLCPICFDAWTNSGDHRLVALKCGHLFGQHCIQHWLQIHKANDRKCPQCKKKATIKDIRPLYALKLRVLDTSEQEELKETIKKLEEEKERLSRELAYERQLHQEAIRIQQEQQMKLQQLQNQGILTQSLHQVLPDSSSRQVAVAAAQIKISLENRVEVSRDGGCRVLAFNEWKDVLVASQSAVSPLFPDFGIRLIETGEFRLRTFIPIHTKAIRDLSFNPHRKDFLLSASFDKTAKIYCISSNSTVMSVSADMPLWSCCWDGDNTNIFFLGSHNGTTLQYDMRNIHTEVSRITTPGDGAPVISLAPIPSGSWLPGGGFLSCRLNRLRVYERSNNAEFRPYPLNIEGPFSALNYDHKSHHMLVSTRPTTQNPHIQLQLYQMGFAGTQPQANRVHSFVGGTTQRVMSRPCQLEIDGNIKDTLICAHQESERHVAIWSVSSGQKLPAGPLPCSEPVLDLCPMKVNNSTFLASLSEKSLRIYKFS